MMSNFRINFGFGPLRYSKRLKNGRDKNGEISTLGAITLGIWLAFFLICCCSPLWTQLLPAPTP